MKKILLSLVTLIGLSATAVKAQTFTVASDTVYAAVNSSAAIHDDITNISSNNIAVRWHVVATNFPTDWLTNGAFGICDNNLCRNNLGDTLLWRTASSTTGSTFTSNNYVPNVAATFDLSLDLSSSSTGVHWVTIALTDPSSFYTKNITFVIGKYASAVSNVNNNDNDVVLYPNPAREELNVVYNANSDIKTMAVYNIIGKVMTVYKVTGGSANMNIESMPSGIYFVRLMNSHGDVVVTRKFTKQ